MVNYSRGEGAEGGYQESEYARQRRIFLDNDPELKALLESISDQSAREEIYWDVKKEADMVSNMDVDKWYSLSPVVLEITRLLRMHAGSYDIG